MSQSLSRRKLLQFIGASAGLAFVPSILKSSPSAPFNPKFRYCLNTATIRAHKLGMVKELEMIAKAGYQGVEIWVDTLQEYVSGGGKLNELRSRINDLGITIDNAIGFAEWIVDDEARRKRGIEQLKKEMDQLAAIGCTRTAAPPVGATDKPGLDLRRAAERYRAILEVGDQTGVVPHVELWGFSANLNKLSDVMFVAIESGHPKAKVLLDNYHLYKGGSNLDTLHFVNPSSTEVFHINDYTNIPRSNIKDEDRVMPGDGISPLKDTLKKLANPDKPLSLSLEIFNKKYYAMDAADVLRIGLEKMKAATEGV
jgi:2-keto-myo-inositol isomerase